MEEIKLNDIADELLIINNTTIERLFQEENKDTLVLYLFYYKTAKWQKHNPIKATDEYATKCLHWGIHRVKNIKKRLKEMELIEVEKRINEKQQIDGWYIKVNYFNSSGAVSSGTISPLVEKQDHKILFNNNINTNNSKNNKEINKERKENIESVVRYLNLTLDTRYKATSQNIVKHINARFEEGYTLDDFFDVIEGKYEEWKGTEMEKYLRPDTLFGTKFDIYLNQIQCKKKN